jgi:hypothetical protein
MRSMTEIPVTKAAFAPAWPYLYKAPDTEFSTSAPIVEIQ